MNEVGKMGVWNAKDGRCYATDLSSKGALIVAGRVQRLLGVCPVFVGKLEDARAQGFKNERGEAL